MTRQDELFPSLALRYGNAIFKEAKDEKICGYLLQPYDSTVRK